MCAFLAAVYSQVGDVGAGHLGELAARLVLLHAHDRASSQEAAHKESTPRLLRFSEPVLLSSFLSALFGKDKAPALPEKLAKASVRFSHFIGIRYTPSTEKQARAA